MKKPAWISQEECLAIHEMMPALAAGKLKEKDYAVWLEVNARKRR